MHGGAKRGEGTRDNGRACTPTWSESTGRRTPWLVVGLAHCAFARFFCFFFFAVSLFAVSFSLFLFLLFLEFRNF
jgi:hypothetical protein